MRCDNNCFNCQFDDCIKTEVDELDAYKAHLIDKEMNSKPNINDRNYKYNHSEKRKMTNKRYLETEKGKETRRKSLENYARNHPDRVRAKSRLYYERHKDEIKARRLAKQKEKNDIFKCSREKCLNCPLERCVYDGYRQNVGIIDGKEYKIERSSLSELKKDIYFGGS